MASDTDDYSHFQDTEGPEKTELILKQARLLAARLERLTPDSAWARRASGCRGTVIRLIDGLERGSTTALLSTSHRDFNRGSHKDLQRVLEQGFAILHAAARESLSIVRGQAETNR